MCSIQLHKLNATDLLVVISVLELNDRRTGLHFVNPLFEAMASSAVRNSPSGSTYR